MRAVARPVELRHVQVVELQQVVLHLVWWCGGVVVWWCVFGGGGLERCQVVLHLVGGCVGGGGVGKDGEKGFL